MRFRTAMIALGAAWLCGSVSAWDAVAQKDDWALTTTAKHEIGRDKAAAEIRRYEAEIGKCDRLISQAEAIIEQAKRKGDGETEEIARKAADKARQNKQGYLGLKKAAEREMALAEATLSAIRSAKKDLEATVEQVRMDVDRAGWAADQVKLIQKRLGNLNRWCADIAASLVEDRPREPSKTFAELQPGDVLLIGAKGVSNLIPGIDRTLSWSPGDAASKASHTVSFLKEVNGKRLFLDNQPNEGPRIIDQEEFLRIYKGRGVQIAQLAQPLRDDKAKKLFAAAMEMEKKNRDKIEGQSTARKLWIGTDTNYGAWGKDNVVCSESDWLLLKAAGRDIPKTDDRIKSALGVDFSPSDYLNPRYFFVSPINIPAPVGRK